MSKFVVTLLVQKVIEVEEALLEGGVQVTGPIESELEELGYGVSIEKVELVDE